jgi:hypothetical protein
MLKWNYEDVGVSNPNPQVTLTTFRPHTHCPTCWGEAFVLRADGVRICTKCDGSPVIVCTPEICASS